MSIALMRAAESVFGETDLRRFIPDSFTAIPAMDLLNRPAHETCAFPSQSLSQLHLVSNLACIVGCLTGKCLFDYRLSILDTSV